MSLDNDDDHDKKEKFVNQARKDLSFIGLILGLLILIMLVSILTTTHTVAYLNAGLGLRTAAMIAAGVTVATLIVFAVVAGDGLLGELQYMILGFFSFFLFFWIGIAALF